MKNYLLLISALLVGCVTQVENSQTLPDQDPISIAESRIALGLGYLKQQQPVKARENLERALQQAPDYYRAQLALAHYWEFVKEPDKARDIYQQALKQHPGNGHVLNNYGAFLCKQGDFPLADEMFNKAFDLSDYYQLTSSFENAALCAWKAGHAERAERYFERLLAFQPGHAQARLQLARLQREQGKLIQARATLFEFKREVGWNKLALEMMAELELAAGNPKLSDHYSALATKLGH
ncbi:type IV pilus biogenesis/stability protein PilW [Vibrio sp.]|uniref:type IV pilus biogenesis/stability protein PilW n=1 Tax=Vibrio sp. TaxID=678 RepID=UPI003D117F9B